MYRLLFLAISVAGAGLSTATYLAQNEEAIVVASRTVEQTKSEVSKTPPSKKPMRLSGVERIPRSANGHYEADFRLNNTTVSGIIDTGASTIAMNKTTARRAGIRLSEKDFVYEVMTANGTTRAARATISRVTFGSIRIRDVDALVLEDKALSTVLIGMSFLNELRGFEYKSGALILKR